MTGLRARYLWPGALVLVCLGLLGLAAGQLVALERQIRVSATENMIWIFGQTQAEALNLALALSGDADPQAIQTRFDLLLSRLTLLEQGPQRRFLESAGLSEPLFGLRADLLRVDPLVGTPPEVLQAHVTSLIATLRRNASLVMAHDWQTQAARLDRLGQLHRLALAAVIGAAIAGLTLSAILIDREKRLMRARLDRLRSDQLANDLNREREQSENHRQFADLLAHQLRTPLAVIDSAMHRLTRGDKPAPPDLVAEKAAVTREAVARLVHLTDTALLMSRLDSDAITPRLRDHDLRELADAVIADVRRAPPRDSDPSRIALSQALAPAIARCDPTLTAEILTNLLRNALLYTPPASPIEVELQQTSSHVTCRIADHGPGMTPGCLARAFDRFARGEGHGNVPGSGLGLTLARHLARLQGGDVTLAPRAGGGLLATISLPAGDAS